MNSSISYQTIYSTQIYLSSATADLYLNSDKEDKSNVVFFFKDIVKIEKSTIEMRLSVVDAQIPVSWYLIDSTNNQISINVNGISNIYTFTPGNYNANSFITLWYSIVGDATIWKLTFNTSTNKFTFQNLLNNIFTFSDDSINSIFSIIGFSFGNVYTTSNNIIISPNCVNFAGINKLNIKTSTFTLKNIDSKNKGRTRTIASIPVNSSANGIIYYNNFTHYKSIFKNHEISQIGIEIQNDFKNNLKFNNVDWNITLQIDIVCEIINNIDTLEDVYSNLQQEF